MNQNNAPFKFLDAYQEEDSDVFFGREKETEELYDALNGVKHLLVYGPSGAGKTSLIECGLRNQFSDADWYAITIRRRNNINATVFEAINEVLEDKLLLDPKTNLPKDVDIGFGEAIELLFNERYQPIYLLFDQFEELLLLAEQEEKTNFFLRLNELIRYRVPCRVILIMREEFIGHLSEFEPLCPSIFKHRYRLEKMGRSNVRQVLFQILEAPKYQDHFEVKDSENLADTILAKLPDKKKEIELTHVQVFLSELWDRANSAKDEGGLPILNESLIKEEDNLESVLDAFLKKQLKELASSYGEKIPLELLAAMISERFTKLQLTQQELTDELAGEEIHLGDQLPLLLEDLENQRIIRTLKTGEDTRYEISHDLLAYVVGQNLTEEMQLREKANEIYRVYAERQGYFSQEDLDYLRPYQEYKAYPPALKKSIQTSEKHIKTEKERELKEAQERVANEQALRGQAEKNAKRATQRTQIATIVAVLALLIAGAAYYFFQDAQRQKKEADTNRIAAENLLIENQRKDSINRIEKYNRFLAEAHSLQEMDEFSQAIEKYELAKEFALDTTEISQAIENTKTAAGAHLLFDDLMERATAQAQKGNYLQSIGFYRRASFLDVDPSALRSELIVMGAILQELAGKERKSAEILVQFESSKIEAHNHRQKAEELEEFRRQVQSILSGLR